MADIQQVSTNKHQSIKQKHHSLFIDMTPMVDLGFLLLTFFILTTTLLRESTIVLVMPDKTPTTHPTRLAESQAFNLILLKDGKIKWYIGAEDKVTGMKEASFSDSSANSLLKILRMKNYIICNAINALGDSVERRLININDSLLSLRINAIKKNPKGIFVLIKTMNDAKYESLIKVFDKIRLADIDRYAMMELSPEEMNYIKD